MSQGQSKITKVVFSADLSVRAVKTGEVYGGKLLQDYAHYIDREELREITTSAEKSGISTDDALIRFLGRHINELEYTQFSIERVKHQFPEIAYLYLVVDVRLVGKFKWVS